MPIEIEAKYSLTGPHALLRRLARAAAQRVGLIHEINTYFDSPDADLKREDRGLRVRIERIDGQAPRSVITHKGPRTLGPLKSREEDEVVVDSADDAIRMLRALGYQPILTFEKRRTRYRLGGCNVEVDELPLLGWFVEIEGPTEQAVLAVRDELELTDASVIRASYIAMLQAHAAEHRLTDAIIPLEVAAADPAELPAAG
jgi:adenylate cyclase class 2